MREDGRNTPFDSMDTMGTMTGRFIIKGEGAQQVAWLGRIDVRNFSQRAQFGFVEEGAQVSLDHKVAALFLLLVHLMQYAVDETKYFGRTSLRQTSNLVECFRAVAQGVRTFHAKNAQVAASAQVKV